MKKIQYLLAFVISLFMLNTETTAQINTDINNIFRRKVEDRVNRKIDRSIDKALDKSEEGIDNSTKTKKTKPSGKSASGNNQSSGNQDNNNEPVSNENEQSVTATGNYDFVAGTKVIAADDFKQDAMGDFPLKWNTNGSGEIVTIANRTDKWLKVGENTVLQPEFINQIPENATLEFDLACSNGFDFYSTAFHVIFTETNNKKELESWKKFRHSANGVMAWFHPLAAGGARGHNGYQIYEGNEKVSENEKDFAGFYSKGQKIVHVAIWRQKTRLRIYIDKTKIWDLPRAFASNVNYKGLILRVDDYHKSSDLYCFANIRLAVAGADTRHKFLDEGKFVTNEILFDVNKSIIKPASFKVLDELGNAVKNSPDIRIKIIGHTDSDGDDKANIRLSEERANAIKNYLVEKFGLNEDNIVTKGKGESEPVAENTTETGKAKNRRVEFIKL